MKRKRLLLTVVLLTILALSLPAQTTFPWFGTQHQPGNMTLSATFAPLFGGGIGIAAYPGVEYIFTKWRPANLFSIDFGVGARGAVSVYNSLTTTPWGYFSVGAGPVLTVHGGLRGFPDAGLAAYLDRLDFFSEFGLGFQLLIPSGSYPYSGGNGLTWLNVSGLNFYFTEQLAVSLSSTVVSGVANVFPGQFGAGIGITYRIGGPEPVGDRLVVDLPSGSIITGDIMYASFSALYWASVSLGGYLPSDDTFDVGDGIRFWHRYQDPDDDEIDDMEFTRALLHNNPDGSRWWRFEFFLDDDELAFEALVSEENRVELIRYEDPSSGQVTTHTPSDGDLWATYRDEDFWTAEDRAELRVGSERVRVPAGSFQTDRLESTEEGHEFTWWVTEEVPGAVVKFEGTTEDGDSVQGELREILRDVRTPWGRAW